MTRKIAIILTRDLVTYNDYDENILKIVESITEWEEVSDEDYDSLNFASTRIGFSILEMPVDPKAFVTKTVSDFKAIAKLEVEKAAKERKKREEAAAKKKMDKVAKTKAQKEQLLKELAGELGIALPQN